jgi:hypothetical protein
MSSSFKIIHGTDVVSAANPLPVVSGVPAADPGVLQYRNAALLAVKAQIKGAAGALVSVKLINPNTVPVYVKMYNAPSASVTVGTTVPQRVEMVPPGDGTTPGMLIYTPDAQPIEWFSAGITIAAVTALADAGTTAPATALYAEVDYK